MNVLKCRNLTTPLSNNDGAIIIVALLMLVALSLTAFMASDNSLTNSRMMRNNRDYIDNLYRAESGISAAVEEHRKTWLDIDSALFDLDAGSACITNPKVQVEGEDGDPVSIASYQVARIEDYTDSGIAGKLDEDALSRDFYPLGHRAPPPVGSGTSPANFEIRRYGIRSQAIPRDQSPAATTVESGLSKFFNKQR